MQVCLVTMPWQSLDLPSLPLSLLRAVADAHRPGDDVRAYYGNIRFAEHVLERTDGAVTPDDYLDIVEDGLFHGLGDWVFTSSLYPGATWPVERYDRHPASVHMKDEAARVMRDLAPEFVELAASEILAPGPDVVGLTSTFMQNVPSLALAAELKRRAPDVTVVMGGGNCDGPMGAALHRNFRALDYVVSGEGEHALVALVDALDAGADESRLAAVPGLRWWRDGVQMINDTESDTVPIAEVPAAEFDEYFAALNGGPVREYVEPKLVHEAARGCWWGMLKHCTFCGLNGATMEFRSKPPSRVFDEIAHDVQRHRVLDVVMVDNIMDMDYVSTLLPQLAATDWDLRVHYEVKSNLRRDHVRALGEAGVVHIQPGIESLSTRVLKIMAKGVDGVTNVRLLRDCEELRVTTPWNYLYGFPGEEPDDYWSIIDQIPNLHHLQPPGNTTRIALERFSPYHRDTDLGFALRKPAAFYKHVFDLPPAELMDIVFIFDAEPAGIRGDVEHAMITAANGWSDAYLHSTLVVEDRDGELHIADRRVGREPRDHVLSEPWEVAGYRALVDGHGAASLARVLARDGVELPDGCDLEAWLTSLFADGLVFTDAGRFVALATADVPARVPVGTRS